MRFFVDYQPIEECNNPDSYGEICVQCNQCGRFIENNENSKEEQGEEKQEGN